MKWREFFGFLTLIGILGALLLLTSRLFKTSIVKMYWICVSFLYLMVLSAYLIAPYDRSGIIPTAWDYIGISIIFWMTFGLFGVFATSLQNAIDEAKS